MNTIGETSAPTDTNIIENVNLEAPTGTTGNTTQEASASPPRTPTRTPPRRPAETPPKTAVWHTPAKKIAKTADSTFDKNTTMEHNIAKILFGNALRCNTRFQTADVEEIWLIPSQGCWFDRLDDDGDAIFGIGPRTKITISKQDFYKLDLLSF